MVVDGCVEWNGENQIFIFLAILFLSLFWIEYWITDKTFDTKLQLDSNSITI